MIALIKPQFEAGKENVGKKGVVRDPKVHELVLERILAFVDEVGFIKRGLTFSPIRGPEGNIEYLLWLSKVGENMPALDLKDFVEKTFSHFKAEDKA